jgi:hypothetical protein
VRIARVKTEKYHNYEEGDCGSPIIDYYKKGFWKKYDRKKFIRKLFHVLNKES